MKLSPKCVSGKDYLREVTCFLQEARNSDPDCGLYEAADLQWWWREDCCSFPERQIFWNDHTGKTHAVLLLFSDESKWCIDLLIRPRTDNETIRNLLSKVGAILNGFTGRLSFTARDDDEVLRKWLRGKGWEETGDTIVQTVLDKSPEYFSELPKGFNLVSRTTHRTGAHPMIQKGRNPADIEERFAECSLYDADLDLSILDTQGNVAAYALFWFDPITKVGLLEPMRAEEAFQKKGLGTYLVREGIKRLREKGATSIKVSYNEENEAAKRLYHGCGFSDSFKKLEFQRINSEPGSGGN